MDVGGTDPRSRAGLFFWPWATTGYSLMAGSSNAAGSFGLPASNNPSSVSIDLQNSPLLSTSGVFNSISSTQNEDALESFYSRLSNSGMCGNSVQQQTQRQRSFDLSATNLHSHRSLIHSHHIVSPQQNLSSQIAGQSRDETPFLERRYSNGMSPVNTALAAPTQSGNSVTGINSASSSPLNNGALHNPSTSPHMILQRISNPIQRQYSCSNSFYKASKTVPSSPLDGHISANASPTLSSVTGTGMSELKGYHNEYNGATAMDLAAPVPSGTHSQLQHDVIRSTPSERLRHTVSSHGSDSDAFTSQSHASYLFPPSSPIKSLYDQSSEASAMAFAMKARVARDISERNERAISISAQQRLIGEHGNLLLSNIGAASHAQSTRIPDFLSDLRLTQHMQNSGSNALHNSSGISQNILDQGMAVEGDSSDSHMEMLSGLYGHATKGYKCKICQHMCFSRQDLSTHNATTHKQDPRPYRCEQCGRQFSTSAYLSQHRRIHTGIKPYVCRFCDRKFTQLSHVQQHERIHTGEKPYKCITCFKSFTQMSNLQSHQRQHMKGKPHRCENCFMSYDSKEELDVHLQAKHAGNRYAKVLVCPACSKNYNSETYLAKHMERHKEAACNSNFGRFELTNTNPFSPLNGFVNTGRVRSLNAAEIKDEFQLRLEHQQDLQRAAAAAAVSFMRPVCANGGVGLAGLRELQADNIMSHHNAQRSRVVNSVNAPTADEENRQHEVEDRCLQHHLAAENSLQQKQLYDRDSNQLRLLAAASQNFVAPYSTQVPSYLNKFTSRDCFNIADHSASQIRHAAELADQRTCKTFNSFGKEDLGDLIQNPVPPLAHQHSHSTALCESRQPYQIQEKDFCLSTEKKQGREVSVTPDGQKSRRYNIPNEVLSNVANDGQNPTKSLNIWNNTLNQLAQERATDITDSSQIDINDNYEESTCLSSGSGRSVNAFASPPSKQIKSDPDKESKRRNHTLGSTFEKRLQLSHDTLHERLLNCPQSALSKIVSAIDRTSTNENSRQFNTEYLRRSLNPTRENSTFLQDNLNSSNDMPQNHSVEQVVDKISKFFPLTADFSSEKSISNLACNELRIEALLSKQLTSAQKSAKSENFFERLQNLNEFEDLLSPRRRIERFDWTNQNQIQNEELGIQMNNKLAVTEKVPSELGITYTSPELRLSTREFGMTSISSSNQSRNNNGNTPQEMEDKLTERPKLMKHSGLVLSDFDQDEVDSADRKTNIYPYGRNLGNCNQKHSSPHGTNQNDDNMDSEANNEVNFEKDNTSSCGIFADSNYAANEHHSTTASKEGNNELSQPQKNLFFKESFSTNNKTAFNQERIVLSPHVTNIDKSSN